jgi:hypothetical protein
MTQEQQRESDMAKSFGRLMLMGLLAAGMMLYGNTAGAGEPMKTNIHSHRGEVFKLHIGADLGQPLK